MSYEKKQLSDFLAAIRPEPVWQSDALFKLYLYCLSQASHNAFTWRGLDLEPGDLPLSEQKAAVELRWSRNKLDRQLKRLSETGWIRIRVFPRSGVLVHVNDPWETEAEPEQSRSGVTCEMFRHGTGSGQTCSAVEREMFRHGASSEQTCSTVENGMFRHGTSSEQTCSAAEHEMFRHGASSEQTCSAMEHNPINNNNSNNNIVSCSSVSVSADPFDLLWLSYPSDRRYRKAEAMSLYRDAIARGATLDSMLAALEADKRSLNWTNHNGMYIPGIVKWLQKETWREYLPKAAETEETKWISR